MKKVLSVVAGIAAVFLIGTAAAASETAAPKTTKTYWDLIEENYENPDTAASNEFETKSLIIRTGDGSEPFIPPAFSSFETLPEIARYNGLRN